MKTPLHKAVDQCHREIAVALMDAGADPNAIDAAGNSPMDVLFSHFRSPHTEPSPCDSPGKNQVDQEKGSGGESDRAAATVTGLGQYRGAGSRCNDDHDLNARRDCSASMARGDGDRSDGMEDWERLAEALKQYGGKRRQRRQRGSGNLCAFASSVNSDNERMPPNGRGIYCENVTIAKRGLEEPTTESSSVSPTAVAPTQDVAGGGCDSSISSAVMVESEPYNGARGKNAVDKYSHGGCPARSSSRADGSPHEYPPPPSSLEGVKARTEDQSLERGGQAHDREVISRGNASQSSVVQGIRAGADDAFKRHFSGSSSVGKTGTATAPDNDVEKGTTSSSGTSRASAAGGMPGTSIGVPCGECRLPKVVMVRASCCGGLICKPCVRSINLRRESCRRCRR